MSGPTLADRLAGGVWGHLVGDALGVPYEGSPPLDPATVTFRGGGGWGQPPGTWSDDGALMLALLDSLLAAGFDTADQARRALAWREEARYAAGGHVFDIGGATGRALDRIAAGVPAEQAGGTGEYDCGNGSLMRILPLALVERDGPNRLAVEYAHRASKVTHGHHRPQVACALYVLVARRLLEGRADRTQVLDDARAQLRRLYEGVEGSADFPPGYLAALDHLESWTGRAGRGRVWDSFWSAWDAFAGADSYAEAVRRAVAYGNDTDTTAAIAGGLAGVYWGIGGIPAEWLLGMRDRGLVQGFVARLLAAAGYETSELRVDWVDLASVPGLRDAPGRLGMTFLPGKRYRGRAGDHWRDLEADATTLRDVHAVDALLLLVEDHELEAAQVRDVAAVMAARGIELLRHPVADLGVPADPPAFAGVLEGVANRLHRGQRVAVACMGGLGRTGTTVACVLRHAGLDADSAITLTRAAREGTIETAGQEEFVRRQMLRSRTPASREGP